LFEDILNRLHRFALAIGQEIGTGESAVHESAICDSGNYDLAAPASSHQPTVGKHSPATFSFEELPKPLDV
jgi:hypothetical protein